MDELHHTSVLNDKQMRQIFSLGCQGPDFLFYHNFLPWKKDKKLIELGSRMHKDACGPFLLELIHRYEAEASTMLRLSTFLDF